MIARRRLWVILAVIGLAVALNASRGDPPRPCKATFERVQVGMTREEVEATVGGPPGNYSEGKRWWGGHGLRFFLHEGWLGPDAGLKVRFGDDGRADDVVIAGVMISLRSPPTLWERFCERLGL